MGAHKDHQLHAVLHRRRAHIRKLEDRMKVVANAAIDLRIIAEHISYEYPASAEDLKNIADLLERPVG